MRWLKRIAGGVVLGRQMRVDVYLTIGDLLTSGFALEKALEIVISTLKDESKDVEAWILRHWSTALRRGRFSQEIAVWVPASEAMIFAAYGRVDATALFVGAGRVTEMRDRQIKALVSALAMPVVLFFTLVVMLWGAGGHFIPVMMDLIAEDDWPATSLIVRDVSLWLYAYPYIFGIAVTAVVAFFWVLILNWTGPGRARFDKIAPFSLYRVVVGSAFMFVLLEYLRAGLDLNDRTFEELKKSASRYTRHRIGAVQTLMSRGKGLGASMIATGNGFPDPKLLRIVEALDGVPGWEVKILAYVNRWVLRSEALMKARASVLSNTLYLLATVMAGGAIQTMFTMLDVAGKTAGSR